MQSQYQPSQIKSFLLKLSGEVLAGDKGFGYDAALCDALADELIRVRQAKYQVAIVLGGGNIFRGGKHQGRELDRVNLDYIGMLATIQNAIYMKEILLSKGCPAEVFSSFVLDKVARHYNATEARQALADGKITFLAGGTGNPYFTTDTAAILRAIELNLDIVLKATKVDGLYTADPVKDPSARFIPSASFQSCLEKRLGVMDFTAFSLAMDNQMPIKIFNITQPENLMRALKEPEIGTYIHP